MLAEARARVADVETGDQPRPMRTLDEPPPPPSQGAAQARSGRAVKRPKPDAAKPGSAATRRRRAQPDASTQEAPRSVFEPAPDRIVGPGPSATMLGSHELLWLEDPLRATFAEPGDGSKGSAPWRRGLRG